MIYHAFKQYYSNYLKQVVLFREQSTSKYIHCSVCTINFGRGLERTALSVMFQAAVREYSSRHVYEIFDNVRKQTHFLCIVIVIRIDRHTVFAHLTASQLILCGQVSQDILRNH